MAEIETAFINEAGWRTWMHVQGIMIGMHENYTITVSKKKEQQPAGGLVRLTRMEMNELRKLINQVIGPEEHESLSHAS